jgi:hypothetical protein
MRNAHILLLALAPSGCSFLFVSGPPDNPPRNEPVDCTKSVGAPVTDTVFAGLSGSFLLLMLAAGASPNVYWTDTDKQVAAVAGGIALMETISAVYGFSRTKECRRIDRENDRERDIRRLRWEMERAQPSDPSAGAEGHACMASRVGGLCQAGLQCMPVHGPQGAEERCVRVGQPSPARVSVASDDAARARRRGDLREFIVANHEKLVAEIAAGEGQTLNALLTRIGTREEQREQTLKWLASVAVQKTDPLDFANAIADWAIPASGAPQ